MDVKINLKICYAKIPSNPSHANFLSCERSFNNTMTQNMGMTTHHLREIGSLRFGVFSKPHETTNFQKSWTCKCKNPQFQEMCSKKENHRNVLSQGE